MMCRSDGKYSVAVTRAGVRAEQFATRAARDGLGRSRPAQQAFKLIRSAFPMPDLPLSSEDRSRLID